MNLFSALNINFQNSNLAGQEKHEQVTYPLLITSFT